MNRHRSLIYSFALILTLSAFLFAISEYLPPLLSENTNSKLILIGVVLVGATTFLANFKDIRELIIDVLDHAPKARKPERHLDKANRQKLLNNVQTTWIDGVRNQALHKFTRFELGLTVDLAHEYTPITVSWRSFYTEQSLLPDTPLIEIFQQQANNTLLILGNPGSGKTLTLLDLAQQLLADAEQDVNANIPVVFNLASWALKEHPLGEWLLDELNLTFKVPKNIGQSLLENESLVLLLDGLDEVAERSRPACVASINAFRLTHKKTGIVVCSRIEEYNEITDRLNLKGAVTIQPIPLKMASAYLHGFGDKLNAVSQLLEEDTILQRWAKSPFLLNIVAIAYQNLSSNRLQQVHTGNINDLFNVYITKVLQSNQPVSYVPQEAQKWLSFLAYQLKQREHTIFLVEQIQPDWLDDISTQSKKDSRFINWYKDRFRQKFLRIEDRKWSLRHAIEGFIKGAGRALGYIPIIICLGSGLFIGLVVGLSGYLGGSLGGWLGVGLVAGLVALLTNLGFGALVSGILDGQMYGEIRQHVKPNQGVWREAVFGLVYGLISMAIFYGASGLIFGLVSDQDIMDTVIFYSTIGSISGLFVGLIIALSTITMHFIIRRLLAYYECLPFNLFPFLEYAKDRLLLRRVGGGYIFIHRTLLEYFAAQHPFPQPPDSPAQNQGEQPR